MVCLEIARYRGFSELVAQLGGATPAFRTPAGFVHHPAPGGSSGFASTIRGSQGTGSVLAEFEQMSSWVSKAQNGPRDA